jgi:hypothetical protein
LLILLGCFVIVCLLLFWWDWTCKFCLRALLHSSFRRGGIHSIRENARIFFQLPQGHSIRENSKNRSKNSLLQFTSNLNIHIIF